MAIFVVVDIEFIKVRNIWFIKIVNHFVKSSHYAITLVYDIVITHYIYCFSFLSGINSHISCYVILPEYRNELMKSTLATTSQDHLQSQSKKNIK